MDYPFYKILSGKWLNHYFELEKCMVLGFVKFINFLFHKVNKEIKKSTLYINEKKIAIYIIFCDL